MSSLVGNLLNIKPIVHVQDGVYVPIGKVRSMKQAVTGMVDFLANKFGADKVRVGVGHGLIDFAKMILEQAVSRLNVVEEPVLFDVGPVIGVHTGPDTVGISVHSVTY